MTDTRNIFSFICIFFAICIQMAYSQNAKSPHGSDFAYKCNICHSVESWKVSFEDLQFDHSSAGFLLTDRHQTVGCKSCHKSLSFNDAGVECIDCHLDIHQSQFGNACDDCHAESGWFDYAKMINLHERTRFTLIGVHQNLDCQNCHNAGEYVNLPYTCDGCHLDDYMSAQTPVHADAGFGRQCDECHSIRASDWEQVHFEHASSFPLTGGHGIFDCTVCHIAGIGPLSSQCYSCHQAEYENTQNPDHQSAGFGINCEGCHAITTWSGGFEHNLTGFILEGVHTEIACTDCHVNNQFSGISSACFSCHESDFNQAQNPDHISGGFSNECNLCHNAFGWTPATFDHQLTQFPLTGAHVSTECQECHINGQYTGTPNDCFFCHEDDYNGTTNPNHIGAGFPVTCADCHTTSNWNAQFDHDNQFFPIYSGEHAGEWNDCAECHLVPTNYAVFTCIDCHEHSQSEMNGEHDGVAGYVWESSACLTCHPDGRVEVDSVPGKIKLNKKYR